MSTPEKTYWPFDVLPLAQQTEHHRRQIAFFQSAAREGHNSYTLGIDVIGGEASNGREADIVRRGKSRWEVIFYDGDHRVYAALVDDFNGGARAVLSWLNGRDVCDCIDATTDMVTDGKDKKHTDNIPPPP